MFLRHTKALQLVCSDSDLFQSFDESIWLVPIRTEERIEYAIEERTSCELAADEIDGVDRCRECRVVANLFVVSLHPRSIPCNAPSVPVSPAPAH